MGVGRPLIEMSGISKSFGPVRALEKVDLTLNQCEVLGLVGDNAAGKSTLMKIMSGAYQPDEGQILWEGQPVRFDSPHQARELGIEMVYQDFALSGNLHIAANIFLGRELSRSYLGGIFRFLDDKAMEEEARKLLDRLRIDIKSVRLRVENLSGGQRQAVAIGRATAFNARAVIMDEPTASLAVKEVGKVLDLIRHLKTQGVSVILISHRLQDVFTVADRIMVLKHGVNVGALRTAETNMDEIVSLMVGAWGDVQEALTVAQEG
jgi:ABC-type sugar transport system ATPase subunit